MSKEKQTEVTGADIAKYWKSTGFKSVKIHLGVEAQHPESRCRFTCKKHYMHHGTFWLRLQDVIDAEEKGLSACPCCAALETSETVDFATFKKDVEEQRKVQEKLDKKQSIYSRRRDSYGLTKYAI